MRTQEHTILSLTRDELHALLQRTAFCARKRDVLFVKWEAACARSRLLSEAYSEALKAETAAFDEAQRARGGAPELKAAQRRLDARRAAEKARRAADRAGKAEDLLWQELEACSYREYAAWGDAA